MPSCPSSSPVLTGRRGLEPFSGTTIQLPVQRAWRGNYPRSGKLLFLLEMDQELLGVAQAADGVLCFPDGHEVLSLCLLPRHLSPLLQARKGGADSLQPLPVPGPIMETAFSDAAWHSCCLKTPGKPCVLCQQSVRLSGTNAPQLLQWSVPPAASGLYARTAWPGHGALTHGAS